MLPKTLLPAVSALFLFLPLVAPAASAATVYTDGMETTTGWTLSGSSVSADCSVRYSGVCSFKADPVCCAENAAATRSTSIAMSGITTVTVWFRPSFLSSDMDSNFIVRMNGGDLVYHTTYGLGGAASIVGYDGWHGYIGAYSTANVWYRGVITIHPGTDWASGSLYDAAGNSLGTSSAVIPADATTITALVVEGVEWGDTGDVVNYDAVSVDVTGSAPTAPTGVSVQRNGNIGELAVSWNPPTSTGSHPLDHYRLYRSTSSGGPYDVLGYFATYDRAYTDSGLADGTRYYYKVGAVTEAGETRSSPVSQTTYGVPSAPTNLVAAAAPGQTTLTWTAPSNNGGGSILEYRVYRGYASGQLSYLGSASGSSTAFTDTTCYVGKACYYAVGAVNFMGESPSSNEASALGMAVPDGTDVTNLVTDADGDGYSNADEALGHSDPSNFYSTPVTDDDCDGVANGQEADGLAALGVGHPVVEYTLGSVDVDPETGAFDVEPPTVSNHPEGSSSC
jgi:hypothetical protein